MEKTIKNSKKQVKKIDRNNYKVVRNMNLLKSLERQGFIEFCAQTGTKISGLYSNKTFTCYYINEAPDQFTYKGRTFGQKYFSGCFYPYLVEYFSE